MEGRVQIERITPVVDCGRRAVKAVVDDEIPVEADVFREGHERIAAAVRYRGPGDQNWREAPLQPLSNDRWRGVFAVDRIGAWDYHVVGWTAHYETWLHAVRTKHEAGQTDLDLELQEGARLLERRRGHASKAAQEILADTAAALADGQRSQSERVRVAADPDLLALLQRHPERLDLSRSTPDLPLWVDREAARFSAWYEMFPRSEGATAPSEESSDEDQEPPRSGTFASAAKRLPAIADMGFDVVYLPPIHPIGRTHRKGRGGPHDLAPDPGDPGVPWAIGSPEGGHTSVHPDLGTLADFDEFVAEAQRNGLEVALDYAIQCSPDHPWVTEHPEWFKHMPDGSIRFAENPPKKYQDIYPLDFDTENRDALFAELKGVFDFWIARGIKIFRVDNPHTKPLPFWEWVIDAIHQDHPDVIFLAEAFTRPKMMAALAKLGFSQSYTYFTWRNTKQELTEYLTELAHTEMAWYFRPNFWPNTPDILTEYLQTGGRPAFKVRATLAALLSPAWGVYSGYELMERTPLHPGSEEYAESEKYRYRPRDWDRPDSLAGYLTRLNEIRRHYRGFRRLQNLRFHHISDEAMLCFSRTGPDGASVLVVVNLDPHQPRDAMTWLNMSGLGLTDTSSFEAHDLMTDTTFVWHGPDNYVRLDPAVEPTHVLRLRAL